MQLTISSETFNGGAQVTTAFLVFYMGCLIFQGLSKLRVKALRAAKKEKFDRYSDPLMRPQDRMVGECLMDCTAGVLTVHAYGCSS
jgi:hypothetical protein